MSVVSEAIKSNIMLGINAALNKTKIFSYIPTDGVANNAQLQAAVNAAYAAGLGALSVFPGNQPIMLDRSSAIIIPKNFTFHCQPGTSFIATGSIPNKPTFPYVNVGNMFAVGNPATGQRYGTQITRFSSGSGATFTLTVTGNVVTSAVVTSGGTGYKVGDHIYLPNSTTLLVTAVSTHRGPVTTVSVVLGGSWSGVTLANPYAQTGSLGNLLYDRVLDQTTFADYVSFIGVKIDGAVSTQLTGSQFYGGIDMRGVIQVNVVNCEAKNFPNTAFLTTDVKRAFIIDNKAIECGWYGVFGTTRNGFSNTGLYLTNGVGRDGNTYSTNSALNTDTWFFHGNQCISIGDVGSQFSAITGMISDNRYLGCGTLSIEGESASFQILDTYAINGGVTVPADVIIDNIFINGTMLYGRLATNTTSTANYVSPCALDGISWHCGNEGRLDFRNIKVFHTQRYGIYGGQYDNGAISMDNIYLEDVNNAATGIRAQAIYAQAENLSFKNIEVNLCSGGPQLYIENRGLFIDIDDFRVKYSGSGGGQPAIYINMYRSRTIQWLNITNCKFYNFYWSAIQITVTGSGNIMQVNLLKIHDNEFIDGNLNYNSGDTPYISIGASAANLGTLNFKIIDIQRNTFFENVFHQKTNSIPINIYGTNTVAPLVLNVSNNTMPQFTTKYNYSATNAATTVVATNNL